MKLASLALAIAILPLALLLAVLPEKELTLLQLEQGVYAGRATPDQVAELAAAVDALRSRAEIYPTPGPELVEVTPLEAWLAARPQSPLGLLPAEEASKYLATRENLVAWIESVDELDDVDVAAVEWTDDLAFLWGVCQEERALYSFVVGHSERERARWLNREQSVGLETELAPCRSFMDRHVGNDSKIWSLVSGYSDEVANKIRGEGEDVEDGDQEASKWELLRVLADAGSPSFDAAVDLLPKVKHP